jgi:hypothetical protein
MNPTNLIVRADSFGTSHAANQAILEGFEAGLLTCASLVVPGPWVAEALALHGQYPEWEIGVQITLRCSTSGCRWGPVAPAVDVPSLVDARGWFVPALSVAATPAEIARECEAQIARAQAVGLSPAFLECEDAGHPAVADALHRLSRQLGIPAVLKSWGVTPLTLPLPAAGPYDQTVAERLRSLGPGSHVWITNPAQDSPETWALWPAEATARQAHAEARALCSPVITAVVQERGIELISVRQHVETRVGTEAGQE